MDTMDVCDSAIAQPMEAEVRTETAERPDEPVMMDTDPVMESTEQVDPEDDSEDDAPVMKRNHRKRSRLDDDTVDDMGSAQEQVENVDVVSEAEDANEEDRPKHRRRLKKSVDAEGQEEDGEDNESSEDEEGDADKDPGDAGDDDYAESDEEKMYERMIEEENAQPVVGNDDAEEVQEAPSGKIVKDKKMTQKEMAKLTSENQRLIRETKTRFPQTQGNRRSANSLVQKLMQRQVPFKKPAEAPSPTQATRDLSDSDSDSDIELEIPMPAAADAPCAMEEQAANEDSPGGQQECSEHFHELVLDSQLPAGDSQVDALAGSTHSSDLEVQQSVDAQSPQASAEADQAIAPTEAAPQVDPMHDNDCGPDQGEKPVDAAASAQNNTVVSYEKGQAVLYTNGEGEQARAVIEGIDRGALPPSYTIMFEGGATRETEISRIQAVPAAQALSKPTVVAYTRKKKQQPLTVAKVAMELDEPAAAQQQDVIGDTTMENCHDGMLQPTASDCATATESQKTEDGATNSTAEQQQVTTAPACSEEKTDELLEVKEPEIVAEREDHDVAEEAADVAAEEAAEEATEKAADDLAASDADVADENSGEEDEASEDEAEDEAVPSDGTAAQSAPEDTMTLLLQKQREQQAKEQKSGRNQYVEEEASEEEDVMDYGSDDEGNEDRKDKFAADLDDLVAKPADMEGVDLERSEELMHLQQAEDEAADEKAQKEVEAIIKGERRHGRRNRRKRAGMQEGLLSDQEDDDDSDSEDLSDMEVDVEEEPEEVILGAGDDDDELENDDVEERRRRLRLRRERLRKERLSKVVPVDSACPAVETGSLLGNDFSQCGLSRMTKSNVSQASMPPGVPNVKLQRHGSFLAMSSDKREKAAGIYCSRNSLLGRSSSFVFSADDGGSNSGFGAGTPNQNSNPATAVSSKKSKPGWFGVNKPRKPAHNGQKLFRSLSMPNNS